jgi:hypothetical protein
MPLAFLSFALRSVSGFQEVILGRFRSFNGVAAERFKNPKRFPMHAQWRHIFHFAPIHPRIYLDAATTLETELDPRLCVVRNPVRAGAVRYPGTGLVMLPTD